MSLNANTGGSVREWPQMTLCAFTYSLERLVTVPAIG